MNNELDATALREIAKIVETGLSFDDAKEIYFLSCFELKTEAYIREKDVRSFKSILSQVVTKIVTTIKSVWNKLQPIRKIVAKIVEILLPIFLPFFLSRTIKRLIDE